MKRVLNWIVYSENDKWNYIIEPFKFTSPPYGLVNSRSRTYYCATFKSPVQYYKLRYWAFKSGWKSSKYILFLYLYFALTALSLLASIIGEFLDLISYDSYEYYSSKLILATIPWLFIELFRMSRREKLMEIGKCEIIKTKEVVVHHYGGNVRMGDAQVRSYFESIFVTGDEKLDEIEKVPDKK